MNSGFKNHLLALTQASDCEEIEVIQYLWSGYGKISRYQLVASDLRTIVVKFISPRQSGDHPRGWNTNLSHQRKVQSYQIETNWYKHWNQECGADSNVPEFIGAYKEGEDQWIILEDLNVNFPLRKEQLTLPEVKVCLKWLANFHGTFFDRKPKGLWKVGTYWHLETRPDEFEKIENQDVKAKASKIDALLNQCNYQTIVHGDAKLANFCFSDNGEQAAAVDFQYVGGGCGMKDVAYFLGSCLSSEECQMYEKALLDFYFSVLKESFSTSKHIIDFNDLELEWRQLYPVACADFTRFLLGWMPSHQKVNDYNLNLMHAVLADL